MSFSRQETESVDLLVKIGMRRHIAATLVYLSVRPEEVTSREIERCADLRQPEVSQAMKYLIERDWVKRKLSDAKIQGRPVNIFSLALPFREIVKMIEKEKRKEVNDRLAVIQKLQTVSGNLIFPVLFILIILYDPHIPGSFGIS